MQELMRSQPRRMPETTRRVRTYARAVFGGSLVLFVVSACDRGAATSAGDTARSAEPSSAGATEAASAAGDASILGWFDRANASDSATGAIAASKATSSDLRAFAATMVRDHHAMRLEGERVARRLRMSVEPPADTSGEPGVAATLSLLNATPRGQDFDKAYLDHEVGFHLDFLETVTGAMDRAGETEVKALIQKLAPMLQEHLDRAKELQERLR